MCKRIIHTILALAFMTDCARIVNAGTVVGEVDVVVSKSNKIGALSREEVRRIFVGDRSSWPGGKHIAIFMLTSDHAERTVVLREVFKMNESDYTKYFLQAAFTGRVQAAPKELPSGALMKARLAANPNAIGYLRKEDVDESVNVLLKLS
jgi:ABC-type phosphate transport system substrate-binding protein